MPTVKMSEKIIEKIIEVGTTTVALDATNAEDLVAKLQANKDATKALEAEYAELQAGIYSLLGYKKVGTSWVGTAEEGTIAGNAIVKVNTIARDTFDKNALLADKPELLPVIEAYTVNKPYKVLKTVR